jgi:hypothetical protein
MIIITSTLALQAAAGDAWHVSTATAWTVSGSILGSKDVSGAASIHAGHGALISNETRAAQPFHFDPSARQIVAKDPVALLAGKGKELDLEAITASTSKLCYYAAGSHGVSRKSGSFPPERSRVFRLPVNAATGAVRSDAVTVTTLLPVLKSEALLRDALGKSSDKGGLDIEGLAEKDGALFFGLRSPSIDGQAFIIEVQADALFADAEKASHRTHRLSLGTGVGIRDIASVSDGFLLIAGGSGSGESPQGFTLYHWTAKGEALTKIGELPAADGKAEGLMVLGEKESSVDLLIFFDGIANGAPTHIQLIKRSAP